MPPRLTCLRLGTMAGFIFALVFVERLDRDRLGLEIGLAQALPLAGREQPVALQITRLRIVDGRVVGIDRDAFAVAFLVVVPSGAPRMSRDRRLY